MTPWFDIEGRRCFVVVLLGVPGRGVFLQELVQIPERLQNPSISVF
jgi:hypothetical protein